MEILFIGLTITFFVIYFGVFRIGLQNRWFLNSPFFILASIISKADGEVSEVELTRIKKYLAKNYSKRTAKKYFELFKKYTEKTYDIQRIMKNLNEVVTVYHHSPQKKTQEDYSFKIKGLYFLIGIATADKLMSKKEYELLHSIREEINIPLTTFQSILAMYRYVDEEDVNKQKQVKQYTSTSILRYYKILELTESATEQEIKEAYRNLVKLYHPDSAKKVTPFSKQQFQFVQEAYDKIKEHKGIK